MSLFDAWRERLSPVDPTAAAAAEQAAPTTPVADAAHEETPAPAAGPAAARRGSGPDEVLAAAVSTARAAIAEVTEDKHIGAHLGAMSEGQRLVTHAFACLDPAYRGWHWVAVLARAPRSKKATVCETALLPGDDALIAPDWLPWSERVRPGDVGPRDVLPKLDEDPNLQPGYEQVALDPDTDNVAGDNVDQIANYEFGLGRERVLSNEGIGAAAARWSRAESGARGEYAQHADAHCGSCGYLLPIAGSVRTQFGVCANAWSPFDGRVVSLDSGCGAHSETDEPKRHNRTPAPVVDDEHEDFEVISSGPDGHADQEPGPAAESAQEGQPARASAEV